jgi:hypothetical protein
VAAGAQPDARSHRARDAASSRESPTTTTIIINSRCHNKSESTFLDVSLVLRFTR